MKKILSLCLAVLLLSCSLNVAFAAEEAPFFFELSVDGSDTKQAKPGDIITVTFYLQRQDSEEAYTMHAMQNEIRYDSGFFRLVEGSALLSDGIQTTDLGLRDNYREFYMNFLSLSGGETWPARRLIGSIQLEVIAQSGVSKITNQDYLVSAANGQSRYPATCQDVTVIISTDCTVHFETYGGTAIPDRTVRYGETLQRPEDPVRAGYHVEGWYSDIDLKTPWDFDNDTVQGNMTLYVKWAQGDPAGKGLSLWWLLILLLLLLLLLLLRKKTVKFETGCDAMVENQKVRRGGHAEKPVDPVSPGRIFAGWYESPEAEKPWDFENDKVKKSMTLYARWL